MKTKEEIIKLYLSDLNNIVKQSPARDNRVAMLELELLEQESKENFKPITWMEHSINEQCKAHINSKEQQEVELNDNDTSLLFSIEKQLPYP